MASKARAQFPNRLYDLAVEPQRLTQARVFPSGARSGSPRSTAPDGSPSASHPRSFKIFRRMKMEHPHRSHPPSFLDLRKRSVRSLKFEAHNAKFLKDQKDKLDDFFASVERNPLTNEQMDSCICMDDAVQIVAAAGSGKTSTIVARIGYALKEGLARPEQILVLAFNRSVKEELEKRIKERLGEIGNIQRVNVKTFNAFGLEVIGKSTGRKPRLADWVEQGRDVQTISEIVEDLQQRDPQFCLDWGLFRTIFGGSIGIRTYSLIT